MINFIYMLNNFICETFGYLAGTWQGPTGSDGQPTERKALLVCFRIKGKKVKILLHAPANYVGVYEKIEDKPWTCLGYHDSCWRSSLEQFLFEHKEEDIRFEFFPPKNQNVITSVSRAVLVISLTEKELETLNEVRRKKYN